jgi:hypothetical protein
LISILYTVKLIFFIATFNWFFSIYLIKSLRRKFYENFTAFIILSSKQKFDMQSKIFIFFHNFHTHTILKFYIFLICITQRLFSRATLKSYLAHVVVNCVINFSC